MSDSELQELWDAEILEAQPEGFTVDTDDKAEWCVEQVRRAEAAMARRRATCRRWLARLERLKARDAADQRTVERMTAFLRGFFDRLDAEGKLTGKSYRLLNGVIGTRTTPLEWERDDARLLPQARALGCVRTREEVDWARLKPRLVPLREAPLANAVDRETGVVIDGVRVKHGPVEVFYVRPDGSEVGDADL